MYLSWKDPSRFIYVQCTYINPQMVYTEPGIETYRPMRHQEMMNQAQLIYYHRPQSELLFQPHKHLGCLHK